MLPLYLINHYYFKKNSPITVVTRRKRSIFFDLSEVFLEGNKAFKKYFNVIQPNSTEFLVNKCSVGNVTFL